MRARLQDGTGTTGRATVFDNRMREHEVQLSAANHISTAQLGGQTGVFTVRSSGNITFGSANRIRVLSITNNDPINLLVIDRAFLQISSSSITLPDKALTAAIDNIVSVGAISIINENNFSNIKPLITARGSVTVGGTTLAFNAIRMFPTLGDVIEFIISGTDSLILNGLNPGTSNNSTVGISIFNATGANVTLSFEGFVRFMMVPPGELS